MKYIIISALLITVAGCQTPLSNAEYQSAINSSQNELFACGKKAVAVLDDKVSPANVIAQAVGQYCEQNISRYVDAVSAQSEANYEPFNKIILRDQLIQEGFLEEVLLHRSQRGTR